MKPPCPLTTRQVAIAAATSAALATAAATFYYVYRRPRSPKRARVPGSSQQISPTSFSEQRCPVCSQSEESQSRSEHQHFRATSDQRNALHSTASAIGHGACTTATDISAAAVPTAVKATEASTSQVESGAVASQAAVSASSFAWSVFWDMENVPVPKGVNAPHFVQSICCTLGSHRQALIPDPVMRIMAIANIHRTPARLRNQLQANGVVMVHVESKGRKDAADKALITELALLAREHPAPFGVALISGDSDFSYPVARLAALGYYTAVIAPTSRRCISALLADVPHAIIPLQVILGDREHRSEFPRSSQRDATSPSVPSNLSPRSTPPRRLLISDASQRAKRRPRKREDNGTAPVAPTVGAVVEPALQQRSSGICNASHAERLRNPSFSDVDVNSARKENSGTSTGAKKLQTESASNASLGELSSQTPLIMRRAVTRDTVEGLRRGPRRAKGKLGVNPTRDARGEGFSSNSAEQDGSISKASDVRPRFAHRKPHATGPERQEDALATRGMISEASSKRTMITTRTNRSAVTSEVSLLHGPSRSQFVPVALVLLIAAMIISALGKLREIAFT